MARYEFWHLIGFVRAILPCLPPEWQSACDAGTGQAVIASKRRVLDAKYWRIFWYTFCSYYRTDKLM